MPAAGLLNEDKISEAILLYTMCLSERARRPKDQRSKSSENVNKRQQTSTEMNLNMVIRVRRNANFV